LTLAVRAVSVSGGKPSRSSTARTRFRVAGATSARARSTFETVGTETPASRATTAKVLRVCIRPVIVAAGFA
jgi:hypothetical protein